MDDDSMVFSDALRAGSYIMLTFAGTEQTHRLGHDGN